MPEALLGPQSDFRWSLRVADEAHQHSRPDFQVKCVCAGKVPIGRNRH